MTTDLFKTAALYLTTPECYDQYFVNFNFFDAECMKSTLSKTVGLGIVAASVGVKVPQILKIIKNKSGKGISLLGVSLELFSVTTFFLYNYLKNFPFSAWGDGLFVGLQSAAILGLILHYKKQKTQLALFLALYTLIVVLAGVGVIPMFVMWYLQASTFPVVIVGKGAQIVTNYKNRGTGQLSGLTCWLLFLGSVARVFTSVQETGDILVILIFVVTAILNGIIVFQLLYYAKPGSKKSKKEKKGKENGKEKQKKKDNGKEKGKDSGKDKGKEKGKNNGNNNNKGKEKTKSKGKKSD